MNESSFLPTEPLEGIGRALDRMRNLAPSDLLSITRPMLLQLSMDRDVQTMIDSVMLGEENRPPGDLQIMRVCALTVFIIGIKVGRDSLVDLVSREVVK